MKKIRSEQDLIRLAELISTEYDINGIWIKIPIQSYNLKRLDKYLFKKFNPHDRYMDELPVTNEEIYVNIGGIQFHLVGDGNYERPIKKDELQQNYFDD